MSLPGALLNWVEGRFLKITDQGGDLYVLPSSISDRLIESPSSTQSAFYSAVVKIKDYRPLRKRQRDSFVRNAMVRLGIIRLLKGVCPSAIIGTVALRTINAVKSLAFRPRPHVFKERLEISSPSIAHGDSRATVSSICDIARIVASLFHSLPSRVSWGSGVSVRSVDVLGKRSLKASAALGFASNETGSKNGLDSAAVALAYPLQNLAERGRVNINGDQMPKALTVEFFNVTHVIIIFNGAA